MCGSPKSGARAPCAPMLDPSMHSVSPPPLSLTHTQVGLARRTCCWLDYGLAGRSPL
ncbi:MAG: hypothetical protein MJE68_33755 [Proteobacteria bacterium]|nr:hypothetical protein [Pseudomonadota bacterium]